MCNLPIHHQYLAYGFVRQICIYIDHCASVSNGPFREISQINRHSRKLINCCDQEFFDDQIKLFDSILIASFQLMFNSLSTPELMNVLFSSNEIVVLISYHSGQFVYLFYSIVMNLCFIKDLLFLNVVGSQFKLLNIHTVGKYNCAYKMLLKT